MFQTYEAREGGQDLAERIARLRVLMAKAGLDAVLVPRADEHQGEYVAPSAERLKWLTGFSGARPGLPSSPGRRRPCSSTAAMSLRPRPKSIRAPWRCCRSPTLSP